MSKEPTDLTEGTPNEAAEAPDPHFLNKEGDELRIDTLTIYDSPNWFLEQLHPEYAPFVEEFFDLNKQKNQLFSRDSASQPVDDSTLNARQAWRAAKDDLYARMKAKFNYSAAFLVDSATSLSIDQTLVQDTEGNEDTTEGDPAEGNGLVYNVPHSFSAQEVPEGITLGPDGEVVVSKEEEQRVENILHSCRDDMNRLLTLVAFDDTPITAKDRFLLRLALKAQAAHMDRSADWLWRPQKEEGAELPENFDDRFAHMCALADATQRDRAAYDRDIPSLAAYRLAAERALVEKIARGAQESTTPNSKSWHAYRAWNSEQAQALLDKLDAFSRERETVDLQTRPETPRTETVSSFGDMDFSELEKDPEAGPILQEAALEYLRDEDRDWFLRDYTGNVVEGFLERSDGTIANYKPSQLIGGGRAMERVVAHAKELLGANTQVPERKTVTSEQVVERLVDTHTAYEELRAAQNIAHTSPDIAERPIISAQHFVDAEIALSDTPELVWTRTDKIVGRSSGDQKTHNWGHEFERRAGRQDEVVAALKKGDTDELDHIFHVENATNQRIALDAYVGPAGPMYAVQDGSHRVGGCMRAGLAEIPASVRHTRREFEYISYDSARNEHVERTLKLGLAKGSVTYDEDAQGRQRAHWNITELPVPWVLATKQSDLLRLSRMYEHLYPGALDHVTVNGKEIPRDVFVDSIAYNHWAAGRWEEWVDKYSHAARDEHGIVTYQ